MRYDACEKKQLSWRVQELHACSFPGYKTVTSVAKIGNEKKKKQMQPYIYIYICYLYIFIYINNIIYYLYKYIIVKFVM